MTSTLLGGDRIVVCSDRGGFKVGTTRHVPSEPRNTVAK